MRIREIAVLSVVLLGAAPDPFTGTWTRGDPEKGGGRLLTRHMKGDVRFELECWRGAPSYNSGFLAGEFRVSNSRGTFRSKQADGLCELEFRFASEEVAVRYLNEPRGCGVGHGVYTNGVYRRESRDTPHFAAGDSRVRR